MAMHDRDDDDDGYASPPCLMHLVDPQSGRVVEAADARQWADVKRWRKVERERLIAARLAIPAQERRRQSQSIADALDEVLGDVSGKSVSVYWPFRGEPDLLPWIGRLWERGATCALPVVIAPRTPLVFRQWHRGAPVVPGVWDIPVPAGGPEVVPDIVVAPLVGFDPERYRLGHGGGFYDRTLASLARKPHIVGVGYTGLAVRTIYPQAHDIPMDTIVTEKGVA